LIFEVNVTEINDKNIRLIYLKIISSMSLNMN